MAQLLMIILNDPKYMPEILQVWREIGVPGTTILKSAGGHRTRTLFSRVGLSALDNLFERKEVGGKMLIATIEDDELLERAIGEAERVVGGFDRPDTGLLMVLPVTQALGMYKAEAKPATPPPPVLRPDWIILRDTHIEDMEIIMELEPTIVSTDTPLEDVARAMMIRPRVHVASVVAEDDRLVGVLSLKDVADSLFLHILPEEFLSEITDIEKMMEFAGKTRLRTAGDAMKPPLSVKREDSVKEAFIRMHDKNLPGLPLVDERYHVIGYVNLLEMLGLCLIKKPNSPFSEETE